MIYRALMMWVFIVGGGGILIGGNWIGAVLLILGLIMLARTLSRFSKAREARAGAGSVTGADAGAPTATTPAGVHEEKPPPAI